ncbi:HS12A-like protein [Mya arenaria]|uniref:HS12A-like protein n=1 Tax=Mya arenaria TaxID=6604 RepID=A0ABY7DKM9_MYAAR|nr:HS12A-like protein [Mya arenaria]
MAKESLMDKHNDGLWGRYLSPSTFSNLSSISIPFSSSTPLLSVRKLKASVHSSSYNFLNSVPSKLLVQIYLLYNAYWHNRVLTPDTLRRLTDFNEYKYVSFFMEVEIEHHTYSIAKINSFQHLKRDTMLEDEQGKKMNAIKVFSICIKYLMEHFMKTVKNRVTDVSDKDVDWVLTVPAIWNDSSKQFMREAAEMVNGGTVDITVHEVVGKGQLKELNWASGGAWGGTRVDAAFEDFIRKLVGKEVFEEFKKTCVEDFVELQRQFETKKRSIKHDKTGKETIQIPVALTELYNKKTKKDMGDAVKQFQGNLAWTAGKLRVNCDLMRGWFKETCDNTVKHVRELFQQPASSSCKTILLVGGFSESPLLQQALRDNFPDKRLIVPEEAGLAVLKGAVLYGHDPVTIVSRVAKCSYGIRVYRDFIEGTHPNSKKQNIGGRIKCKDVFARHVKKGQELIAGEPQSSQRYTPLEADQLSLVFDVYTSPEEDPQYVTDVGSVHIGQLEVDVPDSGKERGVWVKMIFGGTELTVHATDEKTQKVSKASFDFLQ